VPADSAADPGVEEAVHHMEADAGDTHDSDS